MRLSGSRNFASLELTRGVALASGISIAQATVSSSIFGAAPFDRSAMSLPKYSRTDAASFSASAPYGLAASATCNDFGESWFSCGANAAKENSSATVNVINRFIRGFLSMFELEWLLKRRQFTTNGRNGVLSLRRKSGFTNSRSRSNSRIESTTTESHPGRSSMRRTVKCLVCALFFAAVAGCAPFLLPTSSAQTKTQRQIDFKRQIEPIFAHSCYQCHSAKKAMGQLRLDDQALAMKGGISGPSIIPGASRQSLLMKRLLGEGKDARMPMGGDPLKPAEIALIRRWIDQGAHWSDGATGRRGDGAKGSDSLKHWAYVKPTRPAL